ncbi:MAG: molybdopterin molybdotransferase MoeA [Bacteroidales bacterium]|jgi:molybdopterin molybdotransferase|nr:molybdopterin molybdotransferase MoeA [Bacteroidales bacterium]
MIKIEEAYDIVINSAYILDTEKIEFNNSLNRILAEDVKSDIEMPPFDKAAVDGYACKSCDIEMELEVIESVQAGQTPQKKVGKGQCTQIMTGAPVPAGADAIVMVEHTELDNEKVKVLKKSSKSNISIKAEDVKQGQVVLQKGIQIKPQHIAIFASVGYTNVLVYHKPKVGIISTGDELVEPQDKPGVSKIRNSNGHQISAQVSALGAQAKYFGIARDTEEDTYRIVTKAMAESDMIILSGGVSMGEFDFVPGVLKRAGINILFDSIAVKPGKPTTFGIADKKFCFGLPGNPVSSFIQFELLVKPLLFSMMGLNIKPNGISMPMAVEYSRKRAARKSYIPVLIENGKIKPIEYHGSAHIHALNKADGIISIPIGINTLKEGEIVDVRQI